MTDDYISQIKEEFQRERENGRYLYKLLQIVSVNNILMRDCLTDLLAWVETLPIKHPQQEEIRQKARQLVKGDC